MGLQEQELKRTYANVLGDGSIRIRTTQDDPKAVRRDYELRDGTKGTKYEKVYKSVTGVITGIEFNDGEFGKQLIVELEAGMEVPVALTMPLSSNFAEDLMKKIPSLSPEAECTLSPYSCDCTRRVCSFCPLCESHH